MKNKVVIITGGGQGIGRGIVRRFVEEGAKVVIADLGTGKGAETEKEMNAISEGSTYFIPTDVTDEGMVVNLVKKTVEKFGKLDVLVNDAGILTPQIDFHKTTADYFDKVIGVNLRGVFLCMRESIKYFLERGEGGVIVNVASVGGIRPREGMVPYSASKAGAIMAAQVCAKEYAKEGIRANVVAPGPIETEIPVSDELKETFLQSVPNKRMGTTDDIANTILFLASDEARHITGVVVPVDGGRVLN